MPFRCNLLQTMCDYRTFLLDNTLCGLGSDNVGLGDRLCVLVDGGRTPFVIRPAELEDGMGAFLSDAFVRDIMSGQAADHMEQDGKT